MYAIAAFSQHLSGLREYISSDEGIDLFIYQLFLCSGMMNDPYLWIRH
jgi:hypothetical protein